MRWLFLLSLFSLSLVAMEHHVENNHFSKILHEKMEDLIQSGAHINVQNEQGNTPLIIAVIHNRPKVVKTLLEMGADTSIKNNAGNTALDIAHDMGYQEIANMLLESSYNQMPVKME